MDVTWVERELASYWRKKTDGADAVIRACSINLIVACTRPEDVLEATAIVVKLSEIHPARALIVTPGYGTDLDASVATHAHEGPGGRQVCCERVTLEIPAGRQRLVPQTLLQLLVEDLPVYTWWRHDLSIDDPLLDPLAKMSDRLIVYSSSAPDPRSGVGSILEAVTDHDHLRTIRDLTWVRLDGWREMIASFFDSPEAVADLGHVEVLSIVGGGGTTPAGVTASGAYVAGWLASRLGWNATGDPHTWKRPDGTPVHLEFAFDPQLAHGRIGHVRLETKRNGGERVTYLAERLGPERKSVRLTASGGVVCPVPRIEKLNVVEPHLLLAREIERDSDDPVFVAALKNAVTILGAR